MVTFFVGLTPLDWSFNLETCPEGPLKGMSFIWGCVEGTALQTPQTTDHSGSKVKEHSISSLKLIGLVI